MRYIVALVLAFGVIVAGMLFSQRTLTEFDARIRDQLRQQQAAGDAKLQGVDVDTVDLRDFKMTLRPGDEFRIKTAVWLRDCWFIWMPFVVVVFGGIAAVVGMMRAPSREPRTK